ncbi:sensor histidine kinase [Yoonia sediminilitoris]|uniref:histidine kinase n=1 Tax=Yoonia sediminilitoris TaxID=1286148 RepID=A0A2T6KH19_9RHOB|nr:sensor histidine kinase [Yoonia sediminilitoris]PUB14799.1 two-component system sensor histidine kinase ChvG [Yoonia sediminilitoris]RCW95516.1 two-component system sensor histidine kinase ChvG [Yoonia sediminilitoris]
MNAAPKVDVRDLKSVRAAAREPDVSLGDDWLSSDQQSNDDDSAPVASRGIFSLSGSPIARKIVIFNLIALILLIAGVLYLNPSRDNLAFQRAKGVVNEAQLIANVFEAQLPKLAPVNLVTADGINPTETLGGLNLRGGVEVSVFSPDATLVAKATGSLGANEIAALVQSTGGTFVTDFFGSIWNSFFTLFMGNEDAITAEQRLIELAQRNVARSVEKGTLLEATSIGGITSFIVTTPITRADETIGVIAVITAAGEVDSLTRKERELVLRLFLVGIMVSIGLSLVLASTIANPLADLAAAAETSHEKNARRMSPVRVRIPDLTHRPDEIGRLSGALRGMVSALYERIEGNEQFAADVAHEIKNPLASLRSAVGTMRVAKRDDQREKLLVVIEHDVKRLDRLVSDISNASRLDSELVKEEEETFDLLQMLRNIIEFLSKDATDRGIDFIADMPDEPMYVQGLEGRLAQVFVNLISNAVSFCQEGDAIRVWTRRRQDRVLVVVEDTGPGIPDEALTKIFQRFYSERPEGQFGNNSGLGLAISKQIVEAHGGVIWAENIRPTDADATSEPLGARFVVGLPV